MSYTFTLEIEGAGDISDVQSALELTMKQIGEGFTSGLLTTSGTERGSYELEGVCPEGICDGSGEVPVYDSVEPGGPTYVADTKPCLCKEKEPDYDPTDAAEPTAP